jgi:choline dehydrogenase
VGGGSAGSVVANRLSEFYSVLLIENGGMSNPLSLIPALSMSLRNHPQTDWRHKTTPQSSACLNSINQASKSYILILTRFIKWLFLKECLISGGRSLGGSSNLDNLAYVRGSTMDYEQWTMLTGDMSWGYSQLVPFFRRTEQFIGSSTDSTKTFESPR